jgi:nucleotidyltransferase/DNA polymerase involved in DNA repair
VEYIKNGDLQVRNLFEDEYDADVSLMPDSESARYRARLMERVVERIRDSARRANVLLVLVIIPAPFDVVEHYDPAPDPARFPQYRRSGLCDKLQSIAVQLDVASVDLFDPFWKHGAADLYYKAGNDHWNAMGQKLAAEITSTFIKERGILK